MAAAFRSRRDWFTHNSKHAPGLFLRSTCRVAMGRIALALVQPLLAVGFLGYMLFHVHHGFVPNNELHKVGRMAAVTAFKADASLRYPSRMDSNRLVMYFDAGFTDPEGDMRTMEEHLVRMEPWQTHQRFNRLAYARGLPKKMPAAKDVGN